MRTWVSRPLPPPPPSLALPLSLLLLLLSSVLAVEEREGGGGEWRFGSPLGATAAAAAVVCSIIPGTAAASRMGAQFLSRH